MQPRLFSVHMALEASGSLFTRALAGVDSQLALVRPNGRTSHMAFLACHVLDARSYLTNYVGGDGSHTYGELLGSAPDIDALEPPPPEGILEAFGAVTRKLEARLAELTDQDLDAASPQAFPFGGDTVLGGLTFLAWHEAYHVGQMGLVRRYLGLDSLTGR